MPLSEAQLVSVVIPAYNAQATLDETLLSVRAQTHRALEIIVIDDGSTDGTRALAERHAGVDSRVSVLHQPNSGVAAARNTGWRRARSEFIAFIDADDLWASAKIERQLARLQSADAQVGLVYCWHSKIDDAGRIAVKQESPLHEGNVLEPIIMSNFIGNGSSVLIRRDALVAARGFDAGLRARGAEGCEDYLLYYRVATSRRFALLPERLVGYRELPHNMSSNRPRMLRSWMLVQDEILDGHPERARAVARSARAYAAWLVSDALSRRTWRQVAPLLGILLKRHPCSALHVLIDQVLRRGALRMVRGRVREQIAAEPSRHFRSP